jgi:hypothetical protein
MAYLEGFTVRRARINISIEKIKRDNTINSDYRQRHRVSNGYKNKYK